MAKLYTFPPPPAPANRDVIPDLIRITEAIAPPLEPGMNCHDCQEPAQMRCLCSKPLLF